jgi:DNA-binding GntR family transcriptional regulator
MGMSGPSTPTVANYITDSIRSGILEGRYPVGSRLDQQVLAAEFGASIIPVRESLRHLEAEGLVRITPRRGAYVIEPTSAEVSELYQIRAVLEAFATKEAVRRLTPADLESLRVLGEELERIAASDPNEAWTRVNRAWHFKLYEAAQAPLLMQLLAALWDRCALTSHAYVRDPGHRVKSCNDHMRILNAARKGDAELAARIVGEHIHDAMSDLVSDGSAEQRATRGR